MSSHFVIIVAAGTGSRIGGNLPKQFLELDHKPILMHTIDKFASSATKPEIIVVLSAQMQSLWTELIDTHNYPVKHHICLGGSSRFQSVKNGLDYIQEHFNSAKDDKIAVHDAARPFVSEQLIDELYQACNMDKPAVIPAVQSTNSVRIGNQKDSKAIPRESVWLVQTPQVFLAELLFTAYQQEEENLFTDDASVVEKLSNNVYLIPGDHQNLKITYEEDLAIAQHLLNKSKRSL